MEIFVTGTNSNTNVCFGLSKNQVTYITFWVEASGRNCAQIQGPAVIFGWIHS